eukprot:scaffold3304_cov154-Amphora_coffeaeformis.AAC.3
MEAPTLRECQGPIQNFMWSTLCTINELRSPDKIECVGSSERFTTLNSMVDLKITKFNLSKSSYPMAIEYFYVLPRTDSTYQFLSIEFNFVCVGFHVRISANNALQFTYHAADIYTIFDRFLFHKQERRAIANLESLPDPSIEAVFFVYYNYSYYHTS